MNIQRTNTILYCRKWKETVAFYTELFAFPISHQTDWFIEFQITPDSYLSIADESRTTVKGVEGQGVTLSWQVNHLNETHAYLGEQQVAVTPIQHKWGAALFYLHDPEGHRIELWQPLEP
ncbi:MAG: VOC family protein [Anaerolineae bacterium]|nr:VOC family protein [Anaerolineae bacterium]